MKLEHVAVGTLRTNVWLVISEQGNCAVVDPGADCEAIVDKLTQVGATPKLILLTHGHHDHIGAIHGLRQHYGDLPVYIGAGDAGMLDDVALNLSRKWDGPEEQFSGIPVAKKLVEGDVVELDELRFAVLETPGHTGGGVTYLCGDLLLTGDTLFCRNIGRTDLPSGSFDEIVASIKKLYDLEGNFKVLPGHGGASTLDEERADNPYVRQK